MPLPSSDEEGVTAGDGRREMTTYGLSLRQNLSVLPPPHQVEARSRGISAMRQTVRENTSLLL
ncbi:MAG: hypothetical protein IJ519_00195, partial [Clostridia bacterium]|nr:hypothetical protein [Clostridia bacterium]